MHPEKTTEKEKRLIQITLDSKPLQRPEAQSTRSAKRLLVWTSKLISPVWKSAIQTGAILTKGATIGVLGIAPHRGQVGSAQIN